MGKDWIEPALALFREACDMPPDERAAFLDNACGDDAELRRHVEAMLAADAAADPTHDDTGSPSPMRAALSDLARQAESVLADTEALPESIGGYRILGLIAHGGMGSVFLAEQRTPVRRRVALKVIKLGMDSKQIVARFELERQALAVMSHPTIAKVFDAGITEQGQPYFVMEFVEGLPLTDYCDRHKLSLKERIEVFQNVCRGVQHAHQKGVVHRDLKPGNILVASKGDEHTVKIIDFGVARATDQQLVDQTIYTEQGQMIGTPEYMSPEQASGHVQEIDTRTDVYSLGVVLYELLTGELPFTSLELRNAGLLEIQRIIAEVEPQRPSTKISTAGEAASTWAQKRQISVTALRRNLKGELDWIVLRAMAKEPERRYASALGLAVDLGRYLQNEPVDAGPPSASYRMSKFVRRYRVHVAAAALVVVTLVAGVIGTTWFALSAQREKIAGDVARQDWYDDVSRAAALADVRGEITEMKARLVRMAERVVDGERPGFSDAITQFERRNNQLGVGGANNFQGLKEILNEARDLGAAKVAAADRLHARVRGAIFIFRPRKRPDLEKAAVEVAALHDKLLEDLPATDPRKVRGRVLLLDSLNQRERYQEAGSLAVEWLEEGERARSQDDHPSRVPLYERVALYESRLGASLRGVGEKDRAREMLERSVPIVVEAYPHTWYSNVAMANLLECMQGFESKENVNAYRQRFAQSVVETWNYGILSHSSEHDVRLMIGDAHEGIWNWWVGLRRKLRTQRITEVDIAKLEALRKKLGIVDDVAANRFISGFLINLVGYLFKPQGKGDPVIWNLHQIAFRELTRGGELHYAWKAGIYEQRGICLAARGDHVEARRWFRAAVDACADVWLRAEFGGSLGSCLAQMGEYEEAERRLLHARQVAVDWHGPGWPRPMQHLNDLASLYRAWGKEDQAVAWHRIGVEERGSSLDHLSWARTWLHFGKWDPAIEQAEIAVKTGRGPIDVSLGHRAWARALLGRGDVRAALTHFESGVLDGRVEGDGFWSDYGAALVQAGRTEDARQLLQSLTERSANHPLAWQAPRAWRARARFLAETPGLTDADRQQAVQCSQNAAEQGKAWSARYQ